MELKYAHLADYAAGGDKGKPIIVGVFDNIQASDPNAIALAVCYLIGAFTAHVSEGSKHKFDVKLTDADGTPVLNTEIELTFVVTPRRTLEAIFVITLVGLRLPHFGEYAFNLFVDGIHKGFVSLTAVEAPKS